MLGIVAGTGANLVCSAGTSMTPLPPASRTVIGSVSDAPGYDAADPSRDRDDAAASPRAGQPVANRDAPRASGASRGPIIRQTDRQRGDYEWRLAAPPNADYSSCGGRFAR